MPVRGIDCKRFASSAFARILEMPAGIAVHSVRRQRKQQSVPVVTNDRWNPAGGRGYHGKAKSVALGKDHPVGLGTGWHKDEVYAGEQLAELINLRRGAGTYHPVLPDPRQVAMMAGHSAADYIEFHPVTQLHQSLGC